MNKIYLTLNSIFCVLVALQLPTSVIGQWVWDVDCGSCDKRPCSWWNLFCSFCAVSADAGQLFIDTLNNPCLAENIDWGTDAEQLIEDGKARLVELNIFDQAFVDSVGIRWCQSLSDNNAYGFCPNKDMFWVDDHWLTQSFTDFLLVLVHEFTHITEWRDAEAQGLSMNEMLCTIGESNIEGILNGEMGVCATDIELKACEAAENSRECIESGQNCPV